MNAPRFLSPLVRTRTRLTCTALVAVAALTAASTPWWPRSDRGTPPPPPAVAAIKDEATAMVEAVRAKTEVLVETATTATSQTWARPDGKLRTDVTAVPQRTRTADGRWVAIDNTLRASGGLGVTPVTPHTPVTFSGGGAEGAAETVLAEVRAGTHTISYAWPGALPKPVLDGPRALYPEVRPGVDLLVVARQEGGFGSILIVKNRAAATDKLVTAPTYRLRSTTAVFRHDATTGGVRILDAKTGAEAGAIPSPLAWDAAGREPGSPEAPRTSVASSADVLRLSGLGGAEPGARQKAMPTRLDGDGTGDARLRLDAAATGLLTDPEAKYPIFLDPTMNTGDQAWLLVTKTSPNSNFMNGTGYNGGTSDARVGYESDTGVTARSFWRMGFTNIKGADVDSATFSVLNNHTWSCSKTEIQLYQTGAISTGNTWNKQPAWSYHLQTLAYAHGRDDCKDEYVKYSITAAAQRAANAGATNLTLGMRASSEGSPASWHKFQASTATLSATYNRKPAKPSSGTTTPGGGCVVSNGTRTLAKTNVVLKAKSSDPDGNLSKLRFRFWATNASAPAPTEVTTDSGGWASLTIPTTKLADKVTYNWDVSAKDSGGLESERYPSATTTCRITIDASAPPAPDVISEDFPEATDDGATWSVKKFGTTGSVTFESTGATKFTYSFSGQGIKTVTATAGAATVTDLAPRNAGANVLEVNAWDAVGNPSPRTTYNMYVQPSDVADAPGDLTGDRMADLLLINGDGNLRTCASQPGGGLHSCLAASYGPGNALDPAGHWFDPATGQTSLIAKYGDAFPGDGTTDLFVRHYDDSFWLYPGDGYGSFNVDDRIKVVLPSNAPAPSSWSQLKAVGDITGDKLPDLALRVNSAFWILSGYTGATFQSAYQFQNIFGTTELINIADVNLDGTPDLTYRSASTSGTLLLRLGKPGPVAGSVALDSLKTAEASLKGSDAEYGTGWTSSTYTAIIGIPDVNGDRIPDIWVRRGDTGVMKIFHPSTTNVGTIKDAIITPSWAAMKGFA